MMAGKHSHNRGEKRKSRYGTRRQRPSSIVAIPPLKTGRTYKATAALEKKVHEAMNSKELDCPPEPFDD
jgi:hypothetical protein